MTKIWKIGPLVLLALIACVKDEPREPSEGSAATAMERLARLDTDLMLGTRGSDVLALQAYLTEIGYFPNQALQDSYPAWRPIVARRPSTDGTFDEVTAEAVRALQKNARLPETGVVDAQTRALIRLRRCGVPDGLAVIDSSSKYSVFGSKWATTNLTWKVIPFPEPRMLDGVTVNGVRSAALNAFNSWAAATGLTFAETTGTPNITIQFGTPTPGAAGQTLPVAPSSGNIPPQTVTLNSIFPFSTALFTPAGTTDVETVLLHEFGHAVGVSHSGFNAATMFPFISSHDRVLDIDDAVAISSLYDTWETLPGLAKDIGASSTLGDTWIIGTNPVGGGGDFGIWKFNGSGWTPTSGGGLRIAVEPSGIPWIVNTSGQVWRHSTNDPNTGIWSPVPGGATDIGIGRDGSVWIISNTPVGGLGDFTIKKFNGTDFTQTTDVSGGIRIAVGDTGRPWIVNTSGAIYRRTSNDPASGSFQGPLPGLAKDIGIGQGNVDGGQYAWAIGTNSVSGGFGIFVWDEQPASDGGLPPATQQFTWLGVSGGATNISVGPNGRPWTVDNAGVIRRAMK